MSPAPKPRPLLASTERTNMRLVAAWAELDVEKKAIAAIMAMTLAQICRTRRQTAVPSFLTIPWVGGNSTCYCATDPARTRSGRPGVMKTGGIFKRYFWGKSLSRSPDPMDHLQASRAGTAGLSTATARKHPCRRDRLARSALPLLCMIAQKITGARWSGLRFFGLRERQLDSYSSARAGHRQG